MVDLCCQVALADLDSQVFILIYTGTFENYTFFIFFLVYIHMLVCSALILITSTLFRQLGLPALATHSLPLTLKNLCGAHSLVHTFVH